MSMTKQLSWVFHQAVRTSGENASTVTKEYIQTEKSNNQPVKTPTFLDAGSTGEKLSNSRSFVASLPLESSYQKKFQNPRCICYQHSGWGEKYFLPKPLCLVILMLFTCPHVGQYQYRDGHSQKIIWNQLSLLTIRLAILLAIIRELISENFKMKFSATNRIDISTFCLKCHVLNADEKSLRVFVFWMEKDDREILQHKMR